MSRVVLVHGAFNELWGPHEVMGRWVPALRDGLWHHGVDLSADDIAEYYDRFTALRRRMYQARTGELPADEAHGAYDHVDALAAAG